MLDGAGRCFSTVSKCVILKEYGGGVKEIDSQRQARGEVDKRTGYGDKRWRGGCGGGCPGWLPTEFCRSSSTMISPRQLTCLLSLAHSVSPRSSISRVASKQATKHMHRY